MEFRKAASLQRDRGPIGELEVLFEGVEKPWTDGGEVSVVERNQWREREDCGRDDLGGFEERSDGLNEEKNKY